MLGFRYRKWKEFKKRLPTIALYNVSRTYESTISIIIEYQISNWERNARLGDVKLNML